jgi:D-alanine-D-alanine ligase
MKDKKQNITILAGGPSAEHEVSLATGKVIFNTLDRNKYIPRLVTITKNKKWIFLPINTKKGSLILETGQALDRLKSENIDVIFIALHGTFGEDGTIQAFLELVDIPYTGSGILASALAMDKIKSSELFSLGGLNIPKYINFTHKQWSKNKRLIIKELKKKISYPVVVKPSNSGSSVGITIVKNIKGIDKAVQSSFSYTNNIMIQKYISGIEVTCAVLDEDKDIEPIALPPTQIIPKTSKFFDYQAKYTPGASKEITPPNLPTNIINTIQSIAIKTHKTIGCAGMSRTDMIVSKNKIYVLEINTIPGMTETSLYPQAAKAIGITFPKLLDKIIQTAIIQKLTERHF